MSVQHIHANTIGYGSLGMTLAKGLKAIGVDVSNPTLTVDEFDAGALPKTNAVLWVTVPSHVRGYWEGSKVWCFTMWEATKLPEAFLENFDNLAGIIVPNQYNFDQFTPYHPNVYKVNLGIDSDTWVPTARKDGMFFDFLICGAGQRKGTDAAVKAFNLAFPDPDSFAPIPRLVMKNHKEQIRQRNIEVISQRLNDQGMVDLYHRSHVYVQPSRGEGWGYFPHQALATGMPTILSDIPGHRDYASDALGATLIPTKQVKSAYFIYGDSGDWWEPDIDALVEAMRDAYHNYYIHHGLAQKDADRIRSERGHVQMASDVVAAMGRDVTAPYSGDGSWVQSAQRRFPVILTKPWRAEIAGNTYIFDAGKTYYELADVKRILFEANLLDPACLKEQVLGPDGEPWGYGLTLDQVERIGAYSAANERCPTCGHKRDQTCCA